MFTRPKANMGKLGLHCYSSRVTHLTSNALFLFADFLRQNVGRDDVDHATICRRINIWRSERRHLYLSQVCCLPPPAHLHLILQSQNDSNCLLFKWAATAFWLCTPGFNRVQMRGVHPMLFQCWASIEDGGPTLKQHWVRVSCVLGHQSLFKCMCYHVLQLQCNLFNFFPPLLSLSFQI